MEFTHLFYYKIFFAVELFFAELIFLLRLKKKNKFLLRILLVFLINVLVSVFFPIFFYNELYCSMMFFIIFCISTLLMKFAFDDNWINIIFCTIAGYNIQHIAYEFYNWVLVILDYSPQGISVYSNETTSFFSMFFPNIFIALLYFFSYIFTYFIFYNLFSKRIIKNELKLKNTFILIMVVLVIIVDIVFNAVIVYKFSGFENHENEKLLKIILNSYNILLCILALYIQFEVVVRKQIEDELEVERKLRHKEHDWFKKSKENVELIDMKCHDFKNQIVMIGKKNMIPTDYIKEMEEVINIYDSDVETGNSALNIILSEKSLICSNNSISFTRIVDGKLISFMTEGDIYSLFGNLLDNAIEASLKLKKDNRVLGLKLFSENNSIIIDCYNNFDGNITIIDGLPQTTKGDNRFHGFGLKSVNYVVKKYKGEILVCPKNFVFEVKIKFELTQNNNEK